MGRKGLPSSRLEYFYAACPVMIDKYILYATNFYDIDAQ